jgi:hypothetical protein
LGIFGVAATSAGLFASILGAFLTYAARKNGEATRALILSNEEATRELIQSGAGSTRELIQSSAEATRELIQSTTEATRELIRSMEERMTKHFSELLEWTSALMSDIAR